MKSLLTKELTLWEKSNNWYTVTNGRTPQTYEIELFQYDYEEELLNGINIRAFFLEEKSILEDSIDEDSDYFFSDEFIKKSKKRGLYTSSLYVLSFLHKKLSEHYTVEIFKNIKGFTRTVTVPFFIPEENIVILTAEYSTLENIINLLAIPGLQLFFCSYGFFHIEEDSNSYVTFQIQTTKKMDSLIQELQQNHKNITEKARKRISSIQARYKKEHYLSIENSEECKQFYQQLSEEKKRILTNFLMLQRDNDVLRFMNDVPHTLMKFSENILPIDLLIESYMVLQGYLEENKRMIEQDRERPQVQHYMLTRLRYSNRFTEYKLLLKEVNKRYRDVHTWMNAFYAIVQVEDVASEKRPNTDSLHYKAALEAAEEISKLWFVSEIILFGSVAKGEESEDSDIDIAYQIGFDISHIPPARKERFHILVKKIIQKVEEKYENLMDAYPKYTSINKFGSEKISMFSLLGLPYQKKSALKMYEKTGFFNDSITLLQRDSFCFQFNDLEETIAYKDIPAVISPTSGHFNYIVQIIHETDSYQYARYIRYALSYQKNVTHSSRVERVPDDFVANFICFEKWDRNKRYSKYSERDFFLCKNKREHDGFIQYYIHDDTFFFEDAPRLEYKRYNDLTHEEKELSFELREGGMRPV